MQTAELKPLMDRLAPHKVIDAHRAEAAYEVSVQDIHWPEPGEIRVRSGRHCLIELAETPDTTVPGRARYHIRTDDGRERPAGRLNFLPPDAERTVRWTAGHRHAVVCLIELRRLGLLAGIDWRWETIDPASTLNVQNARMQQAMQWLAEEAVSPSFASALQTSCLLTLLATELHRHCVGGRGLAPSSERRLSSMQLQRIRELVEASTGTAPSLSALAQACHLPARELSTMFRAATGQTLRSYVAASHIERAKLLLSDADLLIKQVAYHSGFRSAAAFGDAFRRETGVTPAEYRRRMGVVGLGDAPQRH